MAATTMIATIQLVGERLSSSMFVTSDRVAGNRAGHAVPATSPLAELEALDGKPFPESFTKGQQLAQLQNTELKARGPFVKFNRCGQSGLQVSDLFPHIGTLADDVCLIKSMHTEQINHDPAHAFMNAGSIIKGRPSMGSWLLYGLGAETENLPGFVVLTSIGKAGARISDIALRELDELSKINAKGGLVAAQAYAIHRPLIAKGHQAGGPGYDPQVLVRILRGQEQEAADYIDLVNARTDFIRRLAAITAPYDALVMPTVPLIAPKLADLRSDDAYRRTNAMVLRNPAIANFLDRCSISLPIHRPGEAPVGLMLIGHHGEDESLFGVAAAIERTGFSLPSR